MLFRSLSAISSSSDYGTQPLDARLLDILVCPLCKGPLVFRRAARELICKADRLAFPVQDDIPVMLEDQARRLDPEEEIG